MSAVYAVVGASGGIGAATCRLLEADGARVERFDLVGPGVEALDFRDPATIAPAIARARGRSPKLDGLVLAGGIVDTGKLGDLTLSRWDEVLRINLTGTFLAVQAARDWLVSGGAIVTVSSLAASTGGVITGTAYAASKAGIEALTKSVASELAPRGIRANCVSPGAIDTPMTANHPIERKKAFDAAVPLKRHGRAEEVAATIRFLLSPGAGYITGAVIPVNGGFRME